MISPISFSQPSPALRQFGPETIHRSLSKTAFTPLKIWHGRPYAPPAHRFRSTKAARNLLKISDLPDLQLPLGYALVGYMIPAEAIPDDPRYAKMDEAMASLERTREKVQPVLNYLKDK